jgi:hypothetical protein
VNRHFFIALLVSHLLLPFGRADDTIWTGNKLTSAQPFPAAVRAVLPSWVGYHLLLEEIGGEGRLCIARVWITAPLEYTIVADRAKEVADEPERKKTGWTYVSPAIELDRFSWSLGPPKIGRIFGEEDILRKIMEIRATPTK